MASPHRRLARRLLGRSQPARGAERCPCCEWRTITHLRDVDAFPYFQCDRCKAIFIAPRHLDEIDAGRDLRSYDLDYWTEELPAARERSYGIALARMAEAFYYARTPIRRFLDVGSGPGFFLDAVEKYLPASADVFYGVEKFPPPPERRTSSPRFLIGDVSDVELTFDGGICIEVAEHLTPTTLRGLVLELGRISTDGALYIFNTGMPEYVLNDDPAYLDPLRRGHVASYSVRSLEYLLDGTEFAVYPIPGKAWAFVLEYRSTGEAAEDVRARSWSALPSNLSILDDPEMGSVLKVLGHETIHAYGG